MNELKPKVSVIVPVYKAEAYLHRCVDSLLAQTFLDVEILLIDDGSPDRSGEICDEYAKKDKRVRVFHKENGGVSSARQCGMDNARGEYTIHADPDDWVEPTMLEELYKKAKEDDADMVICDFYCEEKDKTIYMPQKPSSLNHETVLCEMFTRLLHGSSWNKLVRLSCYQQYQVKYPIELSYCEDLYVNACLLSHNIRVAYLPKVFYHYDQYTNPGSLVHKGSEFILSQNKKLNSLLKQGLARSTFEIVYPRLLYSQAIIYLDDIQFSGKTFLSNFLELKHLYQRLPLSRNSKILMWIIFNISPFIARKLYVIWGELHKCKS